MGTLTMEPVFLRRYWMVSSPRIIGWMISALDMPQYTMTGRAVFMTGCSCAAAIRRCTSSASMNLGLLRSCRNFFSPSRSTDVYPHLFAVLRAVFRSRMYALTV